MRLNLRTGKAEMVGRFFFFIAATRSWGQEMAARKIWGRPFWNHLLKYVTDLDFG